MAKTNRPGTPSGKGNGDNPDALAEMFPDLDPKMVARVLGRRTGNDSRDTKRGGKGGR